MGFIGVKQDIETPVINVKKDSPQGWTYFGNTFNLRP